jgi:hypothetical protein
MFPLALSLSPLSQEELALGVVISVLGGGVVASKLKNQREDTSE